MKNVPFFLLLILFCSCKETQKEEVYDTPKVDTQQVNTVREPLPDSVALQLARIAYADFKFGMNENEFYDAKTKNKDYFYRIKDNLYSLNGQFDDSGHLYRLELEGLSYDAHQLNEKVKQEYETLDKIMVETYGEATEDYGFPTLDKFQPEQIVWSKYWKYYTKLIHVGVQQTPRNTYHAIAYFTDEPMSLLVVQQQKVTADSISAMKPTGTR